MIAADWTEPSAAGPACWGRGRPGRGVSADDYGGVRSAGARILPFRSEFGIFGARYSVLRILVEAEEDSLTMSGIAHRLAVTPPNVSKLIEGLVADELVERQRGASDRRVIRVAMTDIGWER